MRIIIVPCSRQNSNSPKIPSLWRTYLGKWPPLEWAGPGYMMRYTPTAM
jgi:hypothetical protein